MSRAWVNRDILSHIYVYIHKYIISDNIVPLHLIFYFAVSYAYFLYLPRTLKKKCQLSVLYLFCEMFTHCLSLPRTVSWILDVILMVHEHKEQTFYYTTQKRRRRRSDIEAAPAVAAAAALQKVCCCCCCCCGSC